MIHAADYNDPPVLLLSGQLAIGSPVYLLISIPTGQSPEIFALRAEKHWRLERFENFNCKFLAKSAKFAVTITWLIFYLHYT